MKKIIAILLLCVILSSCSSSKGIEEQTRVSSTVTAETERQSPQGFFQPNMKIIDSDELNAVLEEHSETLEIRRFPGVDTMNIFNLELDTLETNAIDVMNLGEKWYKNRPITYNFYFLVPNNEADDRLYRNVTMCVLVGRKNPDGSPYELSKPVYTTQEFEQLPQFDKDLSKVGVRGSVRIGNALYHFYGYTSPGSVNQIDIIVGDTSITMSFFNEYPKHEIMDNLLNYDTAPEQIDQIIAAWEGKW